METPGYAGDLAWSREGIVYDYPLTGTIYDEPSDEPAPYSIYDDPKYAVADKTPWRLGDQSWPAVLGWGVVIGLVAYAFLMGYTQMGVWG